MSKTEWLIALLNGAQGKVAPRSTYICYYSDGKFQRKQTLHTGDIYIDDDMNINNIPEDRDFCII